MNLRKFLSFLHHGIRFETDDFSADRAVYNIANLDEHFFKTTPLFGNERRIRGYPIE